MWKGHRRARFHTLEAPRQIHAAKGETQFVIAENSRNKCKGHLRVSSLPINRITSLYWQKTLSEKPFSWESFRFRRRSPKRSIPNLTWVLDRLVPLISIAPSQLTFWHRDIFLWHLLNLIIFYVSRWLLSLIWQAIFTNPRIIASNEREKNEMRIEKCYRSSRKLTE